MSSALPEKPAGQDTVVHGTVRAAPDDAQRLRAEIEQTRENLSATVATLRARGVKVDDPKTGSTKTSITNATDPDGVRLELLDFLPDSLPRKAMDAWK